MEVLPGSGSFLELQRVYAKDGLSILFSDFSAKMSIILEPRLSSLSQGTVLGSS